MIGKSDDFIVVVVWPLVQALYTGDARDIIVLNWR
jgi:hypothetical protein